MSVLLLNLPSFSTRKYCREIMGGFGLEVGDSLLYPPLPLAWQAAIFERAGVRVALIDGEALELEREQLLAQAEAAAPRLIGVITSLVTLASDLAFVDDLKARLPDASVYLTGPIVHLYAERILATSSADFTIDSQNDDKPLELLRALEAGTVSELPGISWRDAAGAHRNPPDPRVIELAELPLPARHLLPNKRYHISGLDGPITTVQTGRGCPFRCDLCAYEFSQGHHYRTRPVANVLAELEQLVKVHGIRHVVFRDITFTVQRKRILELCAGIEAADLGLEWWAETTLNLVDEELLGAMARAGMSAISFGVETGGAEQQAEHWGRKLPPFEAAREVFETCRRLGLETRGYFVLGAPGDTRESLAETIRWARALRPTTLQFLPYRALPAELEAYQAVDPGVLRDIKRAYLSYYLTPRNLLGQLAQPGRFWNRVKRFAGLRAG